MMNTVTVKAQLAFAQLVENLKRTREAGQGSIEYVGIIIVVAVVLAAAITALAQSTLVQDAVTQAFQTALQKLGIGGGAA